MSPDDPKHNTSRDWIVRLRRRSDGKKYYYRHDCCTTARKESSMRLDEMVAKQLAYAISSQHKDFYAWATPYVVHRHKAKKKAAVTAGLIEPTVTGTDAVTCTLVKTEDCRV